MPSDTRCARAGRLALVLLSLISTAGCARVSLPSLPDLGRDDDAEAAAPAADPAAALDLTATPRELLTAHLANPRANPDTPGMTVGKLIEFADRYLACDCAATRFVRAWEKTSEGWRAQVHSGAVRPLEFVCRDADQGRECFLTEIDRGVAGGDFDQRFVPGSEFIQFLYDHGVQCERSEPCPAPGVADETPAADPAPIIKLREVPAGDGE